jgi:hypothetical protein
LTNLGRFTFDNGHSFTWTTGRNMASRAERHANIIRLQWVECDDSAFSIRPLN